MTPGRGPKIPHEEPNKTVWGSPIASWDSLGCPAVCPPQTANRAWLRLGSGKLHLMPRFPKLCSPAHSSLGPARGRAVSGITETEASMLPRPEAQTLPTQSSSQDPGPATSPVTLVHRRGFSCGAGVRGLGVWAPPLPTPDICVPQVNSQAPQGALWLLSTRLNTHLSPILGTKQMEMGLSKKPQQ